MICLTCGEALVGDDPQTCDSCETSHVPRDPVVGINHVSQLLCAFDELREGDINLEEFEEVLGAFYELFAEFENKWKLSESDLGSRLSGTLKQEFGPALSGIDEALQLGFQAMESLEAIHQEGVDALDAAEEALVLFFQGVCANSAALLEKFDRMKSEDKGSGVLFNLPSA